MARIVFSENLEMRIETVTVEFNVEAVPITSRTNLYLSALDSRSQGKNCIVRDQSLSFLIFNCSSRYAGASFISGHHSLDRTICTIEGFHATGKGICCYRHYSGTWVRGPKVVVALALGVSCSATNGLLIGKILGGLMKDTGGKGARTAICDDQCSQRTQKLMASHRGIDKMTGRLRGMNREADCVVNVLTMAAPGTNDSRLMRFAMKTFPDDLPDGKYQLTLEGETKSVEKRDGKWLAGEGWL